MDPHNNSNGHDAAADLALINGGAEVLVMFLGGATEAWFVRQLPIRQMPGYLAALNDEAKTIELLTGKPEAEIDRLTPGSHTELIEKAQELNHVFFEAWYQRRLSRLELMTPGFGRKLAGIVDRAASDAAKGAGLNGASESGNSASPSPIAAD